MRLFNSHDGSRSQPEYAYWGGAASYPATPWQSLLNCLRRERPAGYLLSEIVLLVMGVHLWIMVDLFGPEEPIAPAKPLMMEVSLLAAPKQQQPSAAPPKPPEPPKPKPQKKPVMKKKPVVRKLPKPEPKDPLALPKPAETQAKEQPAADPSPPAPPSKPAKTAAPPSESFTEANFRANYAFNPKPEYPRVARNRGWQGKVLLKVQVSAEGLSESVKIFHSSGHDVLDESAAATVEKWKFIPAMRGGTPVASSVIVPIIFTLNNG